MLHENSLPKYFWANVVSTTCYVLNKTLIRLILKLTSYELFKGRKPNISHLKVFGSKCFVLNNDKSNFNKFDSKIDEGIFYYRIYNKRTLFVEESIHVAFDEYVERNTNLLKLRNNTYFDKTNADLTKKPQKIQVKK